MCSIEARTTSQVMDVKCACTGGHSVDGGGCKGRTCSAALLNSHPGARQKACVTFDYLLSWVNMLLPALENTINAALNHACKAWIHLLNKCIMKWTILSQNSTCMNTKSLASLCHSCQLLLPKLNRIYLSVIIVINNNETFLLIIIILIIIRDMHTYTRWCSLWSTAWL